MDKNLDNSGYDMWGGTKKEVSVPFGLLLVMGGIGLLVIVFMWLGVSGQQEVLVDMIMGLLRS